MTKNNPYYLSFIVLFLFYACTSPTETNDSTLDISGEWTVKLDAEDIGQKEGWYTRTLDGTPVNLPSTLDEAGIGTEDTLKPALNNYVLSHLTRKHSYIGKAWYERNINIPNYWNGRKTTLYLERVLWRSKVWIDGREVKSIQESLITPHIFDLSEFLTSGEHRITLLIDNSDIYPGINVAGNKYPDPRAKDMTHAYTNHTQIKWNGVLGEIKLIAKEDAYIDDLHIFPDTEKEKLTIKVSMGEKTNGVLDIAIMDESKQLISKSLEISGKTASIDVSAAELAYWDEFNPQLYTCHVTLSTEEVKDQKKVRFGYRTVSNRNSKITINGQPRFMRGNLECVIFPLTGRPPMQKEEWATLLDTAKSYGLNHLRFHSWCPPKAAFEAADEKGVYLQVELPLWNLHVGTDANTNAFLEEEATRLLRNYGNHPSFVFMSLGNELQGQPEWLNELVSKLKPQDNRHLYMTTTFSFQKGMGAQPQPEDEYFVTQWTDKGWVRGQGVFDKESPGFTKNYSANMSHINLPVISHEIGQYSVFPDLSEIEKYSGVLKPLNFIAVKEDLEKKGMLHLAERYTLATGKFAALLYKEEIERALRTPEFDGFQLLQLQDFPGQGTALVGLLNAFWESKGAIYADQFRQFCSEVVPLASYKQATFENNESFEASLQVANFYRLFEKTDLLWEMSFTNGEIYKKGEINIEKIDIGLSNTLGKLNVPLSGIDRAREVILTVSLKDTKYKNSWSFWVYPKEPSKDMSSEDVIVTSSFNEATKALGKGKSVLFTPKLNQIKGTSGNYVPVFWSPVHFPERPGTMGILCDPNHTALADFPTDFHSDWQWWDLVKNSKTLEIGTLEVSNIVRVIDNFVSNRNLTNLFEAKVGNGRLIFSSIDLYSDLENREVARQLKNSILKYMVSPSFKPEVSITIESLKELLGSTEE